MSIWNSIDRADFEANLEKLYNIARIQSAPATAERHSSHLSSALNHNGKDYALPTDVEKQICDYLAFFACWKSSPECVTGVTIEESEKGDGTVIALAANEGVSSQVSKAFMPLLHQLEACAKLCKP